jgi:hypothetical protein
MFKSLPVVAFALSVLAAPAWAEGGCGHATTTAQTQDSLEVAQADRAGQSTPRAPKVETSSK